MPYPAHNRFLIITFLVFIVFLISTFFAWRITQDVVKTEVRQNFNQEVQVVKHWMQDRLNLYLPMALGMRIFFESSDSVTANEWSTYIQRLKLIDKYPAISSLTYIERAKGNGGDTYLVKHIEPANALNANKGTTGFDISSDPKRLELFNNIRDEDPTSEGRVILITAPRKGFEIILPVYRKGSAPVTVAQRRETLKGFIQVEFVESRLFQDIFDVVDSANLSFEVYSNLPSQESLLYEQGLDYLAVNSNYQPEITTRDTFEFNSQTWYLVATSRPDFKLTPSQERLPLVVLGSGLIFSFLFLGIFIYRLRQHLSSHRG